MAKIVNSPQVTLVEKLTINYFEAGHSFMACDSVHASIGNSIKRRAEIGDFADFTKLIKESRQRLSTYCLYHKDLINFSNAHSLSKNRNVKLKSVKAIEFRRNTFNMFIKHSHSIEESWTELEFMKTKVKTILIKKLETNQRVLTNEPLYTEKRRIPECTN